MFCSVCSLVPQNLDVRSWEEGILNGNNYNHHESYAALVDSAASGCSLCCIVLHSIDVGDPPGNEYAYWRDNPSAWSILLVRSGIVPRDAPPHTVTIDLVPREGKEAGSLARKDQVGWMPYEFPGEENWEYNPVTGERMPSTRRGITKEVFSRRNLKLIEWWVTDCLEHHTKCQKHSQLVASQQASHLPGRLIDVGRSEDDVLRLIEYDNTKRWDYLTLSHCWGKSSEDLLTTTKETYEERKAGISISSLPPNFRDAVILTRLLGVRYLWIDALCIIQGSVEDFEAEGLKMGSIYGNSLCCIVATSASSCSEGFTKSRNIEPCTMQWNNTDS